MQLTYAQNTHKLKAFTLVELLIVMTIVGTLLSLVGPLTIDSLSKAQGRAELLSIKTWLNYQAQKAFVTGQDIKLSFNGKAVYQLSSSSTDNQPIYEFDYLFFQPQDIVFNMHGITTIKQLEATVYGQKIILPVADWTNDHAY